MLGGTSPFTIRLRLAPPSGPRRRPPYPARSRPSCTCVEPLLASPRHRALANKPCLPARHGASGIVGLFDRLQTFHPGPCRSVASPAGLGGHQLAFALCSWPSFKVSSRPACPPLGEEPIGHELCLTRSCAGDTCRCARRVPRPHLCQRNHLRNLRGRGGW